MVLGQVGIDLIYGQPTTVMRISGGASGDTLLLGEEEDFVFPEERDLIGGQMETGNTATTREQLQITSGRRGQRTGRGMASLASCSFVRPRIVCISEPCDKWRENCREIKCQLLYPGIIVCLTTSLSNSRHHCCSSSVRRSHRYHIVHRFEMEHVPLGPCNETMSGEYVMYMGCHLLRTAQHQHANAT